MTTDKPSRLVPKLRFPEFRDDPAWSAPKLADLYGFKRTNTLSRDKLNYEIGTIRNIHYGDIHTKFKPLFRVCEEYVPYVNPDASASEIDDDAFCEEGDIVLADASEDLHDVGKAIEVVSLDGERVVAGTHTILATRRGSVPAVGFGGQLFQSAAVRAGMKKEAQGAKVYGISAKRISIVLVPVPPTVAEQQKIADCLGSLDDLIAAEDRKLETLRQHKQGLMQQLFPRRGANQPILRFPEFRDSAEWQKVTLSRLLKFQNGYPFSSGDFSEIKQGLRLIRNRDLRSEDRVVYYDGHPLPDFIVNDGDLLVGMDGDFTPCVWQKGTGLLNQRVGRILPRGKHILRFLSYLLEIHLKAVQEDTARTTVKHLSSRTVEGMVVHAPNPDEQQHIANGLSALDICINGQLAKLDTLQMHKRGLLQQLIPSLEGR